MSGDSLTLRDATEADADAMARVKVDTWRTAYRGIIAADFLDSLSYSEAAERFRNSMSLSAGEEHFIVAVDAGRVIGFAIFGRERAVAALDRGEVYAVYVRSEYHGQGIGLALMRTAAARLLEQGIRSLIVWTLEQGRSRQFYEHLGGRLCGSKIAHIGGVGYTHVAYCWSDIRQLAEM
jgi:GNAT superfamily N-acetyltransferase